jgi:hypothetical protein
MKLNRSRPDALVDHDVMQNCSVQLRTEDPAFYVTVVNNIHRYLQLDKLQHALSGLPMQLLLPLRSSTLAPLCHLLTPQYHKLTTALERHGTFE